MPRVIILALLLHTTVGSAAFAQVVSIAKFRHRGDVMEIVSHGNFDLSFHEFDTTLSDTAKDYLDVFGEYCNDSLSSEELYIDLTRGMTGAERERDASLGFKRAKVIIHYLKEHHGIGTQNLKIRIRETTTTTCEGFIGGEKHLKQASKHERRRLKKAAS